eukprot:4001708-Heterocapsa_arctica.AAC.1
MPPAPPALIMSTSSTTTPATIATSASCPPLRRPRPAGWRTPRTRARRPQFLASAQGARE